MPWRSARPGDERDLGVVDDADRPADTEAAEEIAYHVAIRLLRHARDAEAERIDRLRCVEGVDHLKQRLLDAELAVDAEIGAAGAGLAQHRARFVAEQADRLGTSRVDADDVVHSRSAQSSLACGVWRPPASILATIPESPRTPIRLGKICSPFIRSPHAHTSSTLVVAPATTRAQ